MIRRSAFAIALVLAAASCKTEIPIPVDPPFARKDYAQTPVDTPVTLDPLANDHDPNAEVMTVLEIGTATNGTAVLNLDNTITYTPNLGFTGGDSFTVTIQDATGNQVTETAYVAVGASTRIIYLSNHEDYFTRQVYLTDFNFPGIAIPVNQYLRITAGPVVTESNVEVFTLSPDGSHIALLADDSDESNARNVFVVALDQLGIATRVTDIQVGQATSASIPPRLTVDNAYVLYMSNETQPLLSELMMVEVANPTNKVRLNPALVTGESIRRFELTPDGLRVLYVKNDTATGASNLFSVELANPGVETKLNGTPTTNTNGVFDFTATGGIGFRFVPGTTQIVYPSTEAGATLAELWLVDYAAPAAPVKVSGSSVALGVISFLVSNDGTRVVYNAYQDIASQLELYMGSLTAPGTIVQLSAPRTDVFDITTYALGKDSTFVTYVGDDLTDNVFELFKVDFATPGVAVRLNPTLATGDVITLGLNAADPRQLVYTSNSNADNSNEQHMFLLDVDTPEVSVEAGAPVLQFGTVLPIFSPDGATVIYVADEDRKGIQAVFGFEVTDPTVVTKFTPERYGGAAVSGVQFLP